MDSTVGDFEWQRKMNANLDGIPRSGYIFKVCLIVLLLFVDLVINNTADANDLGAGGTTNPIIFIGFVLDPGCFRSDTVIRKMLFRRVYRIKRSMGIIISWGEPAAYDNLILLPPLSCSDMYVHLTVRNCSSS